MNELRQQIELWLLTQNRWVSATEICQRFEVKERKLRALGEQPGLCSDFAISGDQGFKHIRHATDEEFRRAHDRILSHLKHEARRLRFWNTARHSQLTGAPVQFEKFSGQALLSI